MNNKYILIAFTLISFITTSYSFGFFPFSTKKTDFHSELIMLGDFNSDNKWDEKDKDLLDKFLLNPLCFDKMQSFKVDINKNNIIDEDDINILLDLYKYFDPYIAESKLLNDNKIFPRPREFFRYIPKTEYINRPVFIIKNSLIPASPFMFLNKLEIEQNKNTYSNLLLNEIYDETIHFTLVYNIRKNSLDKIEKEYVENKINYCNELFNQKDYFNLLLNLIGLVEDSETLAVKNQDIFIRKILYFRDHLRELLISELYKDFRNNKITYKMIYNGIELLLQKDLSINLKLEELPPPRDFFNLGNYGQRAKWQYYKSTAKKEDFAKLILFAQYDRRYLRSVSKTTRKYADEGLQNHNLPMILLFREALIIKNGDKKAAIGLLDEAIRIPFSWVKALPEEFLSSSIALDNFLLPGNKEDGSDKSRHWNVFGGVSLYMSPEESLNLALRREIVDLKENNYSVDAMTEFIRDTIANINGIYYVMSIDPDLLEVK